MSNLNRYIDWSKVWIDSSLGIDFEELDEESFNCLMSFLKYKEKDFEIVKTECFLDPETGYTIARSKAESGNESNTEGSFTTFYFTFDHDQELVKVRKM